MNEDADRFPSLKIPLCVLCQRWTGIHQGGWVCRAFPGGIPGEILDGRADHRAPHAGDGGVRFEPDWNAPSGLLFKAATGPPRIAV